MSKTSTLLIRTPEGIVFSQLLAGPMSRFLAWLIDFCIVLFFAAFVVFVKFHHSDQPHDTPSPRPSP